MIHNAITRNRERNVDYGVKSVVGGDRGRSTMTDSRRKASISFSEVRKGILEGNLF